MKWKFKLLITNSMDGLNIHLETKHNEHMIFPCDHCGEKFGDKAKLRKHILDVHKSYRPCRNFISAEGSCRYGDTCFFSHKQVTANFHRCYKCGIEVDSVSILMEHRKSTHKEMCKDALLNKCRFSQISCYLNHEDREDSGENRTSQGFHQVRLNPQPPGKETQDATKQVLQQIVILIQTLL